MTQGKIQFKVGNLEFSGEGDEKWLSDQLDKLIEKLPTLVKIPSSSVSSSGTPEPQGGNDLDTKDIPLATFLKEKNVGENQVKRFLATAIWLHGRNVTMPATSDITKALRENHQPKLNNAALCLSKNISKGLCEKQGKQFFITPNGFESLK